MRRTAVERHDAPCSRVLAQTIAHEESVSTTANFGSCRAGTENDTVELVVAANLKVGSA